jgi:hypothetical protein
MIEDEGNTSEFPLIVRIVSPIFIPFFSSIVPESMVMEIRGRRKRKERVLQGVISNTPQFSSSFPFSPTNSEANGIHSGSAEAVPSILRCGAALDEYVSTKLSFVRRVVDVLKYTSFDGEDEPGLFLSK